MKSIKSFNMHIISALCIRPQAGAAIAFGLLIMEDKISENAFVMPGDWLGVEEEFSSADNTFVDSDGAIRAAIIGNVHIGNGKISVRNPNWERRKVERGMLVLGTVTDDMKSVAFIKLDTIRMNGIEYFAIKDGKIVAERPGGPRGRPFGRDREGGRPERPAPSGKQCGVGDVIIAKVLFDDPDVYTLGIRDREAGVVYSECPLCGTHMAVEGPGMLSCPECKDREPKKVSALYGKPEEIKRLFGK